MVVIGTSVTRLGNLLNFGQLLKPLATINLSKFSTFLGTFGEGVQIYHFYCEIIFGNFYKHLAIFFWSHCDSMIVIYMFVFSKFQFIYLSKLKKSNFVASSKKILISF